MHPYVTTTTVNASVTCQYTDQQFALSDFTDKTFTEKQTLHNKISFATFATPRNNNNMYVTCHHHLAPINIHA